MAGFHLAGTLAGVVTYEQERRNGARDPVVDTLPETLHPNKGCRLGGPDCLKCLKSECYLVAAQLSRGVEQGESKLLQSYRAKIKSREFV